MGKCCPLPGHNHTSRVKLVLWNGIMGNVVVCRSERGNLVCSQIFRTCVELFDILPKCNQIKCFQQNHQECLWHQKSKLDPKINTGGHYWPLCWQYKMKLFGGTCVHFQDTSLLLSKILSDCCQNIMSRYKYILFLICYKTFVLINLFFKPQEARAPNCSIFVYLYINM